MPAKRKKPVPPKKSPAKASARSTASGSRRGASAARGEDLAASKMAATNEMAARMPFNPGKDAEHGDLALNPPEGAHLPPPELPATGSTLSETAASPKVGAGKPQSLVGTNPGNFPLDRVRVDSTGRGLTTNQGVPVADNQNSLKAGLRGPTLLEDFILREKVTHFDHERIPGRIHSYQDTQISRLGGPNFHEIPINSPVAQVHNDQRDGMHRQAIHRGRVSYEPNSLAGGCPFQQGAASGFTSFPDPSPEDKVRGKPEKFADHYTQATLFYESQSPVEKAHIIRGFRFELTKVQTPAVRERVLAQLANVSGELAAAVASGLGVEVPDPLPVAILPAKPEVTASPPLSLFARPGDGRIGGRKIAILVAPGVDGEGAMAVHKALTGAGAVPRIVAARLGPVDSASGDPLEPDATLETMPSCLFDAVVVPDGTAAAAALSSLGQAVEFVKDQYRHCKAILAIGAARTLLEKATIPLDGDAALLVTQPGKAAAATKAFMAALAKHRNWERASDPPVV